MHLDVIQESFFSIFSYLGISGLLNVEWLPSTLLVFVHHFSVLRVCLIWTFSMNPFFPFFSTLTCKSTTFLYNIFLGG